MQRASEKRHFKALVIVKGMRLLPIVPSTHQSSPYFAGVAETYFPTRQVQGANRRQRRSWQSSASSAMLSSTCLSIVARRSSRAAGSTRRAARLPGTVASALPLPLPERPLRFLGMVPRMAACSRCMRPLRMGEMTHLCISLERWSLCERRLIGGVHQNSLFY